MNTAEAIRATRLVLFERGWGQGANLLPDGRVCLYGAVDAVLKATNGSATLPYYQDNEQRTLVRSITQAFCEATSGVAPVEWNDAEGRRFNDVLDMLDRAEKFAEASESDG